MLVAQSCPTPCDRMDCSPPGSSVHGILQARILEWLAIPFSRESSQPWSPALQAHSLASEPEWGGQKKDALTLEDLFLSQNNLPDKDTWGGKFCYPMPEAMPHKVNRRL